MTDCAAKWPPDRDARLREMWTRQSISEISMALGVSYSSVASRAVRLGLTRNPHTVTTKLVDRLVDLKEELAELRLFMAEFAEFHERESKALKGRIEALEAERTAPQHLVPS